MEKVKSIKFFADTPSLMRVSRGQGKVTEDVKRSVKPTYFAIGEPQGQEDIETVAYEVTPQGLLAVTIELTGGESKVYLYQLADIVGRIEVTL